MEGLISTDIYTPPRVKEPVGSYSTQAQLSALGRPREGDGVGRRFKREGYMYTYS